MIDAICDLSHWNGATLDFAPAKAAGFLAVVGKASQGVNYVDPAYAEHRTEALGAGLLWGSYHFGTGDAPGDDQASFYLRTVGPNPGELLVLDFEENPNGRSMSLSQAVDFVDSVHVIAGVWPVLYAGAYLKDQLLYGTQAPPSLLACPLWLAQYGPTAELPAGWTAWALWQWTQSGDVPGIGPCDRDRFNGTASELSEFWAAHSIPPPPDVGAALGRVA